MSFGKILALFLVGFEQEESAELPEIELPLVGVLGFFCDGP